MTDTIAAPARPVTRIEPLLSSRLFMAPQLVGNRLFFISNLSGHFSLYVMDAGGSVPEPLLPPDIALQNPELLEGSDAYHVYPQLGSILVMIDHDGDENYQPMLIPIDGGLPEPAFGGHFTGPGRRNYAGHDRDTTRLFVVSEEKDNPNHELWVGDLATGELDKLGEGVYGPYPTGVSDDAGKLIVSDGYTIGDHVISLLDRNTGETRRLYGTPLEERAPGEQVAPNSISACVFIRNERGIVFRCSIFEDTYGLGYIDLSRPDEAQPVTITGIVHSGVGEMTAFDDLPGGRYRVDYNIDGASWVYEGTLDEEALELHLDTVLVGQGELSGGTLEHMAYDSASNRYALSFSTATSPTQLYILEGQDRHPVRQTRERILGIPAELLAPGEDASFQSYDGLRISARLYLPSTATGFEPPYPLVYYVHGGPQSQERPNFAWFSMPLIQYLTINGFAVFVPNVRGSEGYGLSYMKQVDHDWGGRDRLDHVHAMGLLARDERIDTSRAGVMGRSYGGYMTLTLATRHPELWKAAIDMFGPYNLLTFTERLPETWKPYFKIAVGDPETEADFLLERSPSSYIGDIQCPLFIIQGANDPRVTERESRDIVDHLQARGKEVDILVFENEGHDVLKFENRVRCYTAIAEYFRAYLQ